jgi:hypothetical protein
VRHALVPAGGEELLEPGRWLDPGRRELDRFERHRLLHVAAEAEPLANPARCGLEIPARRLAIRESPAPVLSSPVRDRPTLTRPATTGKVLAIQVRHYVPEVPKTA